MNYKGYAVNENGIWYLVLMDGEEPITFFKDERLTSFGLFEKRLGEKCEEMGWYEYQIEHPNEDNGFDEIVIRVFYDTLS